MSDKYYRGLRNFLNDTKYKLQLASMTLKINENKNNINGIKNDITDNLTKIGNLEKYLVSSNGFNKVYNIEKQILKFNKDTNFFKLFEIEIEHDFTIDSLLIITNHLHFKYDNLNNDYHRCQNEYNIYNENDLIYTYIFNHDKYYNENLDTILYTNEDFCIRFKNNYKKIKIVLNLHRHNRHGVGDIDLEIDDNENYINIDYLDKNNENSDEISSNLGKINDNDDDIDEIKSNLNNIKNDFTDFKINYSIQNLFIYNINVERNYTLNKDNPEFIIFNYNLEDNFKSNSFLEINCKLLYDYIDYNNIGTLMHVFKLYDENDTLLHEYKNLKTNSGDNLKDDLNQIDLFYVKLNDNYSVIKIELILSILNNITKSVSCKLYNSLKSNFICIKHYKKINTLSVNNNLTDLENDILLNLSKIETNKSNISSNLEKINNVSKNKLINISNDIFYNDDTQVNFSNDKNFFEKQYNISFKKDDFVEIYFTLLLNYVNITYKNYVKSIYKISSDNNVLYERNIDHRNYSSFNNHLTIDEKISITLMKTLKILNSL